MKLHSKVIAFAIVASLLLGCVPAIEPGKNERQDLSVNAVVDGCTVKKFYIRTSPNSEVGEPIFIARCKDSSETVTLTRPRQGKVPPKTLILREEDGTEKVFEEK